MVGDRQQSTANEKRFPWGCRRSEGEENQWLMELIVSWPGVGILQPVYGSSEIKQAID
jgi:hypothetical protein